jgi:hypothetical protein
MPLAFALNGLLPGRGPGRGPPREAGRWPGAGLAGLEAASGVPPGPGRGPAGAAGALPGAGNPVAGTAGTTACGVAGSGSRWTGSATGPATGDTASPAAGPAAGSRAAAPAVPLIAPAWPFELSGGAAATSAADGCAGR